MDLQRHLTLLSHLRFCLEEMGEHFLEAAEVLEGRLLSDGATARGMWGGGLVELLVEPFWAFCFKREDSDSKLETVTEDWAVENSVGLD